jgi:hypothetical protein
MKKGSRDASQVSDYFNKSHFILSRDGVNTDGVWIGNRIWHFDRAREARDYTLQITITQRLVFSVTVFIAVAW